MEKPISVRIKIALDKKVIQRTKEEHLLIIKEMFNMNIRDYLLSMGQFRDEKIQLMNEVEFLEWLYLTIGDDEIDYMYEISQRIKNKKRTSEVQER